MFYTTKDFLVFSSYDGEIKFFSVLWKQKYQVDVPIRSFFGAELCDLKGLYALYNLKALYKNNEISLYRDDSLAII